MKRSAKRGRLRSAGQFVVDALTGRVGLLMMTLAYSSLAVVLLAYVSTQVYTNSLMEDVTLREAERRRAAEKVGVLMRDYAGLVSRSRVTSLCEKQLGMVPADTGLVVRVRLERASELLPPGTPSEQAPVRMPEVLGSEMTGITEAMRR